MNKSLRDDKSLVIINNKNEETCDVFWGFLPYSRSFIDSIDGEESIRGIMSTVHDLFIERLLLFPRQNESAHGKVNRGLDIFHRI